MYTDRKALISDLEKARSSKVLLYVTGDRPGWEAQISSEAFDPFVDHLDTIGVVDKISLVLYTRGGDTLAGWSLVNLVRQFCNELEVIIPHKCHSTGTLIALGANKIVMTKQATLGPIDPSVNTPLNPHVEGAPLDARVSVSVQVKRVLAESLDGGSDYFQSEGTLSRVTVNTPAGPQPGINDARKFEGWRRLQ